MSDWLPSVTHYFNSLIQILNSRKELQLTDHVNQPSSHARVDGWIGGCVIGWMDEWMDGPMA